MAQNNWKNYLVKIIVPGCKGQDYIATGYPFKENCILTAKHAVVKEDVDSAREWLFKWEHIQGDDGNPIKYNKKNPEIIISDGSLDWAVIRFPFDTKFHHAICFCHEPPSADSFVQSEGFPANRHKNQNKLPQLSFQGNAHIKADSEDYFQCDIGAGYTDPEDSGGLSGAPMINRDGQIVGLFAMVPEGLAGGTVWVLSTTSILKDQKFSCLLAPEQKSPRYAAIRKLLESAEFSTSYFRQFLISAFDIDCQEDEINKLTEVIDSNNTQQCLSSLYRQAKNSSAKENIDHIISFCNQLLPEYITPEDQDQLNKNLQRTSADKWYQHSAATHEGIETHMANYDKRLVSLKSSSSSSDQSVQAETLYGEYSIDFPEAAGGIIDPETKLDETENSFYVQFSGTRTREVQYPRLQGEQHEQKDAKERLRKSASKQLRHLSEEQHQTQYYVRGAEQSDTIMEKLASQCPYFLLLQLSDDQDKIDEEDDCFRSLKSLYKLNQEK